jgi:serine/threonine protein kinase
MAGALGTLLITIVVLVGLGLGIAFILVPMFKGIGWAIVNLFRAIGWLGVHLFEFVGGMISDVLRFVGSVITLVALLPFPPLNVVLGRWSAAGHFAESISREFKVAAACLYRVALRRPLKLFWLHGLLEGVEQRLPEAMAAAPTRDTPSRRAGQYAGYRIVGSLRGGGSGGKLYIAEPEPSKRSRIRNMPDRVVIKSFALSEGSSLPQIVRESRALEAARELGLVFEHGMDDHRFFYVMPYHAGEHLGVVTRQLHGESDGRGLSERHMPTVLGYFDDLLETLAAYHRGGLWHKDVKPENVIVHDGRAHIVDLGLVTPLRSAMTLTTHGTEYFRDPEMVRQALRGVKVHQVDGAKFDIFAVGAVLYFVLENTFPAHGGLSRFTKKSPEALRWIARRAMADYNQRYETVEEMLADLRVVAASADPGSVRPVDLPSMGGAVAEAAPAATDPSVAAIGAGSPVPPPLPVVETPAPVADSVAPADPPRRRPGLRVTNWWTGAYAVDETGDPVARPDSGVTQAFRDQSRSFRAEAHELRRRVQTGAISSRRAAREQIKAARARARDLQKRARSRRHRTVVERQPSRALIGATLLFVGFIAVIMLGVLRSPDRWDSGTHTAMVMSQADDAFSGPLELVDGPPVLLIVDGEDTHSTSVRTQIKRIMHERSHEGFHVLLPDDDGLADTTTRLLHQWSNDPEGPADDAIEDILDEQNLFGVVWVTVHGGNEVRETLIHSTFDGAEDRRFDGRHRFVDAHGEPGLPLLLVNDHPAKSDPRVEERVQELIARYERRRQPILVNDEAEAAVRQFLPTGTEGELPMRFHRVLGDYGFGGVLRIGSGPGDGAVHERLTETQFLASPPEEPGEAVAEEAAAPRALLPAMLVN